MDGSQEVARVSRAMGSRNGVEMEVPGEGVAGARTVGGWVWVWVLGEGGKNGSHDQWESSLSSQINPIILKIEEELKRLRTPEASSNSTADVIRIGLSGLGNLYKCVQQPLNCLHRDEKCINTELLEASSKLLDVGIATRDITILLKDATRSLRSALGEKRSESSIQSSISDYVRSRRKLKKKAKGLARSLKGMDDGSGSFKLLEEGNDDDLVKMRLKSIGGQGDNQNELIDVDAALRTLCSSKDMTAYAEKTQLVDKKLKALLGGIEGMENGLDSMIMQLIKTRASLLNVFSF
ncbi:hypothetical protein Ancab_026665 [Ancistrocladus abbreviatus]